MPVCSVTSHCQSDDQLISLHWQDFQKVCTRIPCRLALSQGLHLFS